MRRWRPDMALSLPTRRDEAWRYADLEALEAALALPQPAGAATGDARALMNVARQQIDASLALVMRDGETRTLARTVEAGSAAHSIIGVHVPKGVTATLVEPLAGNGWLNHGLEITVDTGGTLRHVILQERDTAATTTLTMQTTLEAGARHELFILQSGSGYARLELDAVLHGEGGHFGLAAAILARDAQTAEIISTVRHESPGATSDQAVRTVVAGRATGSYLGKIHVARDAQQTDAQQSSKSLLLDRTATANVKPELEIYADDVKCAHGATVGELDRQALFYLAARGVDPATAKALLTEAFVADVVEQISADGLRADVAARTLAWLHTAVAEHVA